jgi:hypothetical protein
MLPKRLHPVIRSAEKKLPWKEKHRPAYGILKTLLIDPIIILAC